jgi:hypothetical protein
MVYRYSQTEVAMIRRQRKYKVELDEKQPSYVLFRRLTVEQTHSSHGLDNRAKLSRWCPLHSAVFFLLFPVSRTTVCRTIVCFLNKYLKPGRAQDRVGRGNLQTTICIAIHRTHGGSRGPGLSGGRDSEGRGHGMEFSSILTGLNDSRYRKVIYRKP